MMEFVNTHWIHIVVALLAVSEVLAMIPAVKANSIFQAIVGFLRMFKPKTVQKSKEQKRRDDRFSA